MRTEASIENPPPRGPTEASLRLFRRQPTAPEDSQHPPADLGLEGVEPRPDQFGRLVKAHGARGIELEHPLEHAAVVAEVDVDGTAEAVQERNGAESRLGPRTGTDPGQPGPECT